jgi:Skp family chaperone for outer membrane proteins
MKPAPMKRVLVLASLFTVTAGVLASYPYVRVPAKPKPAAIATPATATATATAHHIATAHPKIEVVFVLDTTSSMGGLIEGAKENIWSIASSMAQAHPTPELHMGLVAFRDRGDDYVTKVIDLSTDLDSMYSTLMEFHPAGGGDGPESVNQALHDAVHRISWSQDPQSYKAIFLVGDAPPHMDYPDDVKYPETLKAAAARGIVVNAIQAGNDPSTRQTFERIAMLEQGAYFQVAQQGDALAVATPYDEKIAALSREVDATRLYFGDAEAQRKAASKTAATEKVHAEGSVASRAKRAVFNAAPAGAANMAGENELVDAVASGRVDLGKLDADELPAALRDANASERQRLVQENADKRVQLQAQIAELGKSRSAYIADDLKRRNADSASSLDDKLYSTIKEQAGKKGLSYDAAAAH